MDVTRSQPYPSLARARYAQAVLFAVALIKAMDVYVVALLIEPMKRDLGLSDIQVGLATTTIFYLTSGLLSPPLGMLSDRRNRVRLLQLAILLFCGGLALGGLSHDLWLLMFGKVLTGIGSAISYPAAMSLSSDYFPPRRRAFATMTYPLGQMMGSVCAALVGGLGLAALTRAAAADPHALFGVAPWRIVSLIFAAGGLVLIPLLALMREPARQEVGQAVAGGTLREIWAYRSFLIPTLLAIMCLSALGTCIVTWVAPALTRVYGQQPGDFAKWLSGTLLVSGLLGLVAGVITINAARRRAAGNAVMRPAMWTALAMTPACCLAIMPNVAWFAVALATYYILSGVAMSIAIISINFRLPNELRGLTLGLQVVLSGVAAAIGAPMVAFVAAQLGGDMMIGHAIAVVSVPFALAATLCLWLASRAGGPGDPVVTG